MTAACALAGRPRADPTRDAIVGDAVAGDVRAFAVLVARHRRELHAHCLRILRSPERAEDAVQEALLRAWRARSGFAGRAEFRSWLYRIATNACLDEIRRDRGGSRRLGSIPFDDDAQHPPSPADLAPDAVLEAKEALEEAFLAVMALLPPRQRAVLVLRGVLDCPAAETARLLGMTAVAVNSALQRARAALSTRRPVGPPPSLGPAAQAVLDGYVDAMRGHDVARVVALARADLARPATSGGG